MGKSRRRTENTNNSIFPDNPLQIGSEEERQETLNIINNHLEDIKSVSVNFRGMFERYFIDFDENNPDGVLFKSGMNDDFPIYSHKLNLKEAIEKGFFKISGNTFNFQNAEIFLNNKTYDINGNEI